MKSLNGAECTNVGTVSSAWGRFLHQFPWCHYAYLTFRGSPSVPKALHTFRFWMHQINKMALGNHYAEKGRAGVRYVRGLEWQRRGSPHFHVLLADTQRIDRKRAIRLWKKLGGMVKLAEFDREQGACFYVAKTYGPTGPGELDFGGPWVTSDSHRLSTISRRRDTV